MEAITCPSCGCENDADMKFCGECGAKLEATLVLNKESYDPGDEIHVTAAGITKNMKDSNAFAAIYPAGAAHDAYMDYQYPDVGGSTLYFQVPDRGAYELRLYRADGNYSDESFVTSVPFTVGAAVGGGPVCPSCGYENKPGTKFCGECGSKLS